MKTGSLRYETSGDNTKIQILANTMVLERKDRFFLLELELSGTKSLFYPRSILDIFSFTIFLKNVSNNFLWTLNAIHPYPTDKNSYIVFISKKIGFGGVLEELLEELSSCVPPRYNLLLHVLEEHYKLYGSLNLG